MYTIVRKAYTRRSPSGKLIKVKAKKIKSTRGLPGKLSKIEKKKSKKMSTRKKGYNKEMFVNKKCPPGYISRTGYVAIRNGKPIAIKTECVEDRGKKGKSKIRTRGLEYYDLGVFGYKNINSMKAGPRHKALASAVKKYGHLSVFRKLILLSTVNKNTNKSLSQKFRRDANWVRKMYA